MNARFDDMPSNVTKFRRRESKEDQRERELLQRFNEKRRLAALIKWPEIPAPQDWCETDEELAEIDFEGMPEFHGDGYGCGTPEFREQLEAYFSVIKASSRHAFAVLQFSRSKLTEVAKELQGPNEEDDGADAIASLLGEGLEYVLRLARYLRAAQVRQICAIALRDEQSEASDPAA